MTKKKNCTDCGACSSVDGKVTAHETTIETPTVEAKETINYGFYSKVLQKPFDSLSELMAAEDAHAAEQRAKEEKVSQKKLDAQKVEYAFKALNAARKIYKEDLMVTRLRLLRSLLSSVRRILLQNLLKLRMLTQKHLRNLLTSMTLIILVSRGTTLRLQ